LRIGIIAALPGELKPLVRGWQRMPVPRGSGLDLWQQQRGQDLLTAACGGMGSSAAMRAFTAAEHAGSLDVVFSIGWAGALTAETSPGSCYVVSEIIDTQTGERFAAAHGAAFGNRLVTTGHVALEAEKQRLAASYAAKLVDMEAATIARLAQMRDIPMYCCKGVTDGLKHPLPDLNDFINVAGKMEMGRFLAHVAVRPQYWSSLMKLGRNGAKSAECLAALVSGTIEEIRSKPE
jgi:adenosylhomocysteine nucleosidase